MLTDSHVHLGPWPFSLLTERKPAAFVAHLGAHGIRKAIVEHLGAVFAPEPGPSNQALFSAVRGHHTLIPIPTINPLLANWQEELEACCAAAPITAVKIIPNYHNYSVAAPRLAE